MTKAAIVILNFNGEAMLRRFLPSVVRESIFEIVIIDNASTDGSIHFLKQYYPTLTLIQLPKNLGYSGGYTEGLGYLRDRFQYYILLNSDVEVTEGWDSQLVQHMDANPSLAACQPKILSLSDRHFFDYAGAVGGYLDLLGYPFCRGRILHTLEQDHGQYDTPMQVDWCSGACFCIRAACFHDLGGFDPLFFAHMEEIDLCWRLRNKGWQIGAYPLVSVFHLGGGTLSKANPKKTYLNFRNSLYMLYKNLKPLNFALVFFARAALDLGAMIHMAFMQGLSHSWAIHRAYLAFLLEGKRITKANAIHRGPVSSAKKKVGSIILAYYLRGKRRYSQLS